jgi:hypothetical protein
MALTLSALRAGCSPFTPVRSLVLISVRGLVDRRAMVRLEGLGQLKSPMNSSELEPMALRLVAQCLNKLRYKPIMTIEDSNMEAERTGKVMKI